VGPQHQLVHSYEVPPHHQVQVRELLPHQHLQHSPLPDILIVNEFSETREEEKSVLTIALKGMSYEMD
jgi:hypothetical protein